MKIAFQRENSSKKASLLVAGLVIFLSAVFAFGLYLKNPFFTGMEFFFYDQFMKSSASKGTSGPITIIDIDEKTLSAVGQWPWPRYRLAQLVGTLAEMKPKAIALDIILPEPDRTSLINIQKQFERDFKLNLGFTGVPSSLRDNDGYVSHVFKQAKAVGARYFYFDHFNQKKSHPHNPFQITDTTGLLDLHRATGVMCNTPEVEKGLEFTGFINNQHDGDGLLRQTPLLIEFQGTIFANLALSALMKAQGIQGAQVFRNVYGFYLKVGNYKIPVTQKGGILLRFEGPSGKYEFVSAVDILNHNVQPADFKGKIVFIGSSAVGLNDVHHTLFDSQFPGVEAHTVIVDNIYNNEHIIRPLWSDQVIFAVTVLTGLIMIFLFLTLPAPAPFFVASLAWICLILFLSYFFYLKLSIFVSPGSPVLLAVVLFVCLAYARFALARRASFLWYERLAGSQQLTMEAMVNIVETRDPETGQHVQRTQYYARALAQALKKKGQYSNILTDPFIKDLFLSAPLHDIGKVGVPDSILLKPGKLTDEEFAIMKTHSIHGERTLQKVAKKIQGDNYLVMGAEIAGSHHERWDGNGYPRGLSLEEIPLSGRIMAISDVYDALISRRCYKPPFSHEKSMAIIVEGKGSFFDPVVVDAFVTIEHEIKAIAARYTDSLEL